MANHYSIIIACCLDANLLEWFLRERDATARPPSLNPKITSIRDDGRLTSVYIKGQRSVFRNSGKIFLPWAVQ